MAVTVRDLLGNPGMPLRLLAARAERGQPIRWVHASELEDPTPWLKGGRGDPDHRHGHRRHPGEATRLREAARRRGRGRSRVRPRLHAREDPEGARDGGGGGGPPALRGPVPRAVHRDHRGDLHAGRRRAVRHPAACRRRRARAHARRDGGARGRGDRRVARRRDQGVGAAARPARDAARRHRPRRDGCGSTPSGTSCADSRPDGTSFSVTLVDRGHHIWVQPVGAQGRVEAFLAVGKPEQPSQLDRIVAGHALSLFAIELATSRAVADAQRRLQGDFFDELTRRGVPADRRRPRARHGSGSTATRA